MITVESSIAFEKLFQRKQIRARSGNKKDPVSFGTQWSVESKLYNFHLEISIQQIILVLFFHTPYYYIFQASSTEKSDVDVHEEKSEIYSNNMTEAMGAGKCNYNTCSVICHHLFPVILQCLHFDLCLDFGTISWHAFCDPALTYRHELGMNYNFILPDLIVGSCLQVLLIFFID